MAREKYLKQTVAGNAYTTSGFYVNLDSGDSCTIFAKLAGSDTLKVVGKVGVNTDGSPIWEPLVISGTPVVLSATDNVKLITDQGNITLEKVGTTGEALASLNY